MQDRDDAVDAGPGARAEPCTQAFGSLRRAPRQLQPNACAESAVCLYPSIRRRA